MFICLPNLLEVETEMFHSGPFIAALHFDLERPYVKISDTKIVQMPKSYLALTLQ